MPVQYRYSTGTVKYSTEIPDTMQTHNAAIIAHTRTRNAVQEEGKPPVQEKLMKQIIICELKVKKMYKIYAQKSMENMVSETQLRRTY